MAGFMSISEFFVMLGVMFAVAGFAFVDGRPSSLRDDPAAATSPERAKTKRVNTLTGHLELAP